MAEKYKALYRSTLKTLKLYQKRIVPELRARIEELEQVQRKVTPCEECALRNKTPGGYLSRYCCHPVEKGSFCSYGERRTQE